MIWTSLLCVCSCFIDLWREAFFLRGDFENQPTDKFVAQAIRFSARLLPPTFSLNLSTVRKAVVVIEAKLIATPTVLDSGSKGIEPICQDKQNIRSFHRDFFQVSVTERSVNRGRFLVSWTFCARHYLGPTTL